jgi:transposase-like protein
MCRGGLYMASDSHAISRDYICHQCRYSTQRETAKSRGQFEAVAVPDCVMDVADDLCGEEADIE